MISNKKLLINPKHRAIGKLMTINSKRKQQPKININKLSNLPKPIVLVQRRVGGLGDVIMSTPMLVSIKKMLPHCQLVYATDTEYEHGSLAQIIAHCPVVDKIISNKEIREWEKKCDYTVDITGSALREEKAGTIPPNRIDLFAEEAGISIANNPVPLYKIKDKERTKTRKEIRSYLYGERRDKLKFIAIQIVSKDARRTWPIEHSKKLIELLSKREDVRVFILDWNETAQIWEKYANPIIPFLNRTIADTAALIDECDLVVCPDSSMLHLAGALEKRIVTTFGPIPPQSRINYYINAKAVVGACPMHPCFYTPRCIGHRAVQNIPKLQCLSGTSPELVYRTIFEQLQIPTTTWETERKKYYNDNEEQNTILVKRSTRGIGDIAMTLTGIEALKLRYPDKGIHLAIQPSIINTADYSPLIDKVIDINSLSAKRNYFLEMDISQPCAKYESTRLSQRKPVQLSRVEVFSEALGTRDFITDLLPRYYVKEEEDLKAKEFLKSLNLNQDKPTIFLAPKAFEIYRDYPEKHWQPLIDKLYPYFNILLATRSIDNNKEYNNVVNISHLDFRNKMAILNLCDGVIVTDTGPLHIAAALKVPTIALFGPIDCKVRCKGYKNTSVIISNRECIPCWRNGYTGCKYNPGNVARTYSKCLEEISPSQIAKIAIAKFNKRD